MCRTLTTLINLESLSDQMKWVKRFMDEYEKTEIIVLYYLSKKKEYVSELDSKTNDLVKVLELTVYWVPERNEKFLYEAKIYLDFMFSNTFLPGKLNINILKWKSWNNITNHCFNWQLTLYQYSSLLFVLCHYVNGTMQSWLMSQMICLSVFQSLTHLKEHHFETLNPILP